MSLSSPDTDIAGFDATDCLPRANAFGHDLPPRRLASRVA